MELSPVLKHSLLVVLALVLLYMVGTIVYNLFFHPLRKYPGPLLLRASRLPWALRLYQGKLIFDVLALHKKYGDVVRIAPNELTFSTPEAWKDIFGRRIGSQAGVEELSKYTPAYRPSKHMPTSILSCGREEHSFLRRALAHSFSDRSMREQEPIIRGYINLLMQKLRENCVDSIMGAPQALDMMSWYNWTTFDIIGDLTFGEPFGCLENSTYHSWVKLIFTVIQDSVLVLALKLLGFDWLVDKMFELGQRSIEQHNRLTTAKLRRRMELSAERPDLIEGLLRKNVDGRLSFTQLRENASILIAAGSETTATLLSGVTYFLCANPDTLRRLTDEVRSTFKSEDEITFASVNGLTYMLACLNEALRRHPPAPSTMPRETPPGGVHIAGYFVPGNTVVSIYHWPLYHNDKWWYEPFEYHPERFLSDSDDKRFANDHHEALQPFSVGPRNCIGKNLAYAEMRTILARIVYNFDLTLADDSRDWANQRAFALWEKPPLNVYLTPVQRP